MTVQLTTTPMIRVASCLVIFVPLELSYPSCLKANDQRGRREAADPDIRILPERNGCLPFAPRCGLGASLRLFWRPEPFRRNPLKQKQQRNDLQDCLRDTQNTRKRGFGQ